MLVVTRKVDEAIVIGEGIEVRILRCGRDGVRLGITAPPEVAVHRSEVYDAIRAANAGAAASRDDAKIVNVVRARLSPSGAPAD